MNSFEQYYCPECGMKYEEGEHICKGCGTMGARMREELLSMKEQQETCKKCGAGIKAKDKYCCACGEKTCK